MSASRNDRLQVASRTLTVRAWWAHRHTYHSLGQGAYAASRAPRFDGYYGYYIIGPVTTKPRYDWQPLATSCET